MMATAKKETAEQRLLKMIETSSGSVQNAKTQQTVISKRSLLTVLKSVNQVLTIVLLASVAFLAFELLQGFSVLSPKIQINVDQKKSNKVMGVETIIPVFQNVSYYLSGVTRRNIFQPIESEKARAVVSTDRSSKLAQLTQNCKLVGISWLNSIDSASAMIEDTDKKITYFLQKGEKMGDITVKTIYADSAVLGYENEEIIIKYDKPQM